MFIMGAPPTFIFLLLKVFDQPFFKKVAGFQGSALNRRPQTAKYPYGHGSLRWNLSRSPQRAEFLFHAFLRLRAKPYAEKRGKKLQLNKQ